MRVSELKCHIPLKHNDVLQCYLVVVILKNMVLTLLIYACTKYVMLMGEETAFGNIEYIQNKQHRLVIGNSIISYLDRLTDRFSTVYQTFIPYITILYLNSSHIDTWRLI